MASDWLSAIHTNDTDRAGTLSSARRGPLISNPWLAEINGDSKYVAIEPFVWQSWDVLRQRTFQMAHHFLSGDTRVFPTSFETTGSDANSLGA